MAEQEGRAPGAPTFLRLSIERFRGIESLNPIVVVHESETPFSHLKGKSNAVRPCR